MQSTKSLSSIIFSFPILMVCQIWWQEPQYSPRLTVSNLEKIKTITEWPQPQTIREVRNFHGLGTFYRQFIKNFSAIVKPITDFLKNKQFQQTPGATKAFRKVKKLMTQASVMRLRDFSKVFEVTCDASGLTIGGVLSQKNHLVAYFSEKLNDARHRYSTNNKEFYVAVHALRH